MRLEIAHNALTPHKPQWYVLKATIIERVVLVEYMDENSIDDSDYTTARNIPVKVLENFIEDNYCAIVDYSDNGEHGQFTDTTTPYDYLLANTEEVCTDFLNKKIKA